MQWQIAQSEGDISENNLSLTNLSNGNSIIIIIYHIHLCHFLQIQLLNRLMKMMEVIIEESIVGGDDYDNVDPDDSIACSNKTEGNMNDLWIFYLIFKSTLHFGKF